MIKYLDLEAVNARHGDEIHRAVAHVVDSGWYLLGQTTARFEADYARYIGTAHCVGCGNGLDALTLILRAYMCLGDMSEGDEVIVPANTFFASVLAVVRCGLRPVMVEPDADTLQIDDRRIEQAITPRTRAVMIVHLYGRCAYTDDIAALCRRHGLKLIEDNAQAHGCTARPADATAPRRTGSLGDAAGHSFYPGKNLGALGDGGAVTTDDSRLAHMVRTLANYGSARKYVFDHLGMNSRLDEIQAAVLTVKLRHLDDDNERRRAIARYYEANISNERLTMSHGAGRDNVYHIFPVFCDERDRLQQFMLERGIQTMIHYPIPPYRQRCYTARPLPHCPITDSLHRRELSIPLHPALTDGEAEHIVRTLNAFI